MNGLAICVFLTFQLNPQALGADADPPTCTSDECESIMPGYRDVTVYVRPKRQHKYTYIEAETACLDLNATVVTAVDERNKGYLEFAAALKFGINFDVWYFKGPILRSDNFGVPDENATCYAMQSKEAPDDRRYTKIAQVDCQAKRDVICEIPRRGACGDWEPAWLFNGSCYKICTTSADDSPLESFAFHARECKKMDADLASIHSDEEMRFVLNIFAKQLEWDTEAGLRNNTDWHYYMAFLGMERRKNTSLWTNTDNSVFDYGDPMGQVGRWPWCGTEPDRNASGTSVVRIGSFNPSSNTSVPFENPRNYGCWKDMQDNIKAPYAICKRNATGHVTGSSRFFYYEPEVSQTQPPSPTTIASGRLSRDASVESGENDASAAEIRQQRRPDRHA